MRTSVVKARKRIYNCAQVLILVLFLLVTFFVLKHGSSLVIVLFWTGLLVVLIVLPLWIEVSYLISSKFYVKSINLDEPILKNKKLIHYSNRISKDEYEEYQRTGKIRIFGHSSAKSSYMMRFKDKRKPVIWFHLSKSLDDIEPDFLSFINTHFFEEKRRYKVVVEIADIEKEGLFINPKNNNIIVVGDLYVPATVKEDFKWFDDRLYLNEILYISFFGPFLDIHRAYHQMFGMVIDFYCNRIKMHILRKE